MKAEFFALKNLASTLHLYYTLEAMLKWIFSIFAVESFNLLQAYRHYSRIMVGGTSNGVLILIHILKVLGPIEWYNYSIGNVE